MSLRPSSDDIELTRALDCAADLLGLKLLNHLIVAESGFVQVEY